MRTLLPSTLIMVALAAGCNTVTLAPGAAQVKISRNAADVAACIAVGNAPPGQNMPDDLRNFAIGLGGNTIFVTRENLNIILDAVIYRCP